jgi:hypothetical protein
MDGYRSRFGRITAGLTVEQRLEMWLDTMRTAGGLRFAGPEPASPSAARAVELAVPDEQMSEFGRRRDLVLSANAVLALLMEKSWERLQLLLARAAALAGPMLLAGTEWGHVLRTRAPVGVPSSGAGAEQAADPIALAADLLGGLLAPLLATDDPPFDAYWREQAGIELGATPPVPHQLLPSLLRNCAEPLARAVGLYCLEMRPYLQGAALPAADLLQAYFGEPVLTERCVLAPLDELVDRHRALAALLGGSRFGRDALGGVDTSVPLDTSGVFGKAIREPDRHPHAQLALMEYRLWLRGELPGG